MIPGIACLLFPVLPGELGHGLEELVLISGEGCEIRGYLFPFSFAPEECVCVALRLGTSSQKISPLFKIRFGVTTCCNLQYVKNQPRVLPHLAATWKFVLQCDSSIFCYNRASCELRDHRPKAILFRLSCLAVIANSYIV
jgi:hypothetical protein